MKREMLFPRILFASLPLALGACGAMAPVAGDADQLSVPLTPAAGDAARGRALTVSREGGHCILCHALPEVRFAGNIGPPLNGVGARLNIAQLRRRVVDITAISPESTMPAFHRVKNLQRVAPEHRGKPVLDAQQVEDVVAYLATLRE